MADDITLTVRVRDMTRGDFNRLDQQLDRMRRSLQGVSRDGESAGMHAQRLGRDINQLGTHFQALQRNGSLTRRELINMTGVLDGMSRSALNAARSGEITGDKYRALNGEIQSLRAQFNYLGRDLNRNTNALRTHSSQINTTVRRVNGVVRSVNTTTRTINGNTRTLNTWTRSLGGASNSLAGVNRGGTVMGKTFGNMHSKLIGVATVMVASLLPTIGALAPMLAGVGAVAGVAALAFSGLSAPTKFLSKDQKDFLKALKPVREEFVNLRKSAQAAVLPKITKSFGDIKNMVKDLNPVIKIAGDTFGNLVGKIARGISSDDFMKPFTKNVQMGTEWLEDFAGSFGDFSKAFFDFGTKSKPALDAWQNMLGGFLDRGLPNMFKEMEKGVGGSSAWLNGLASAINDNILPALGKMIASFMDAFGPLMGQMIKTLAEEIGVFARGFSVAMTFLKPFANTVADIMGGLTRLGMIAAETGFLLLKELGGAFVQTIATMTGQKNPFASLQNGFRGFGEWVAANQGTIRAALASFSIYIIDMVQTSIEWVPQIAAVFSTMSKGVISSLQFVVSAFAGAMAITPGGDKWVQWAADFNVSAEGWKTDLDGMVTKSQEFADAAVPNLERARVDLRVESAEQNLASIKRQLQDPELTKERKATLTASKEAAERELRAARSSLDAFDRKEAEARLSADPIPFLMQMSRAERARISDKSVRINGDLSPFRAAVGGVAGQIVGTSYINVRYRQSEANLQRPFSNANGSIMKFFADGGTENHVAQIAPAGSWRVWGEPETGGESYIPLSPGKRPRSRAIAEETVGILGGSVQWFAKGGKVSADTKSARSDLARSFGVSTMGKVAGYRNTPFEKDMGKPASLSDLVGNINETMGLIKKAFSGKTEKNLLSKMSAVGKTLIRYDQKLIKVNSSLDKATDKLNDLKQASSSLRTSVAKSVISDSNITRLASGEGKVKVNDILNGLRQSQEKSNAFASALTQLKDRGVSKTIIEQVAEAGVEGGGLETANALLRATPAQLDRINMMQSSIGTAATAAGKIASEALYGAGIKAAQGLVDGLTKNQKAIEAAMMRLAKSMEKSLKKALGIKSPSRVTRRIGEYTAEGFAVGMKENRSIDTAWASMLNPKKGTPATGGVAGAAGGGEISIPIYIGGRFLDEVILDSNRRTVRTRGGNVQAVFGTRTR